MICRHCAGWGKYSVPPTHQLYGKRCKPCGGTGNEPARGATTIVGRLSLI